MVHFLGLKFRAVLEIEIIRAERRIILSVVYFVFGRDYRHYLEWITSFPEIREGIWTICGVEGLRLSGSGTGFLDNILSRQFWFPGVTEGIRTILAVDYLGFKGSHKGFVDYLGLRGVKGWDSQNTWSKLIRFSRGRRKNLENTWNGISRCPRGQARNSENTWIIMFTHTISGHMSVGEMCLF